VDGKSDWLISIMKDFDWLQVHINNGFKNSSVKATIKPVTDEQVFYDKFLCDKFYLLVCTRNFDNFALVIEKIVRLYGSTKKTCQSNLST
jgi:hypothetical protein